MTTSEKNRLLKVNTACWIAAIALPVVLHFSLGGTKFPWPILVPLLLLGPLLASNNILSNAIGQPTDDLSKAGSKARNSS